MLSIGKLSAGQQEYYDRQVAEGRDDYYSGRGEAPGEWAGRGARALGLEGRVSRDQLNAMVAGLDPSDPDLERPLRIGSEMKVVGYDLVFSAPKSVSVLFGAGDEALAGELIAAHESAVRAALGYVEDAAVVVRRGHGGLVREAGEGLIVAAYRHRMSRSLDPQLHTHLVCGNLAKGPDGRYTALDGRELYGHAKAAGFLYQAHLRAEVRERLGLEWGPVVNGCAELEAVPVGVREEFSRRRAEILDAAREAGVTDLNSSRGEYLATTTRNKKTYGVETHTWREEVQARASEHGLTRDAIDALTKDGRAIADGDGDGDESTAGEGLRELGDHLAGPAGLTNRANTFTEREVLMAHAAAATQGARVGVVREQGAGFAARGDVRQTTDGDLTSEDLVTTERGLIASAIARAETGTAIVAPDTLERSLAASDRPLTEEQAAAVRAVASSGNGVDVIEALAGTGKTFTAGTLRQVYEDAGFHVIGVAPTGRAVRELAEEAGIPAWTLDRSLMDFDRHGALPENSVVIFDEAGMAATRATARLLEHAQKAGAKVVAIGDPGQLPSVQAGGWMTAVGERVGVHRLTLVMRQRDLEERRALAQLHAGNPEAYTQWADLNDRLQVHPEDAAVASALADYEQAAAVHGRTQAVLIARSNDTRAQLNAAVREQRKQAGELGEELAYGPVEVAVGDRVICRRNDYAADVDNGTRGTVRHVHERGIVLETDAGIVRELPAEYVAEHLEHAYCLTGHGMQGATVEEAIVVASPGELSRGWSYTALSRARGTTRLHIDTTQPAVALEREEMAPGDREAAPTRAQTMGRVNARMQVRDDEDLAMNQIQLRWPGQVDDSALTRASAGAERAAETAEPAAPRPGVSRDRLSLLQAQADVLRAQRDALPLRELGEVDRITRERDRLLEDRAGTLERLRGLPEVPRRRLGKATDPHEQERRRLTNAIAMNDQHIAALDLEEDRARRRVGAGEPVRDERDALDRRISDLDTQADELVRELAEQQVERPPRWARELLGEQPETNVGVYDEAVRELARYRLEHHVPDQADGLGPVPDTDRGRSAHRSASRMLERAQRALGRETGRGRGRER